MIEYFVKYHEKFLDAFLEHVEIVLVTLLISLILVSFIMVITLKSKELNNIIVQLFGAIYSIPSLALFALLIPIMGLGQDTAILVLVVYNQFLLVRNISAGIYGVDESITEAATGMGMNWLQVLFKIQIPLAFPMIMAGIRLAVISTIGIATIAATINAGGLGAILFQGLGSMNTYKIVWGTILCAVIAFVADAGLKKVEKIVNRKVNR